MSLVDLLLILSGLYAIYYFYPKYKPLLIRVSQLTTQVKTPSLNKKHPVPTPFFWDKHLMIYGATGLGKSTFVDYVLSELIQHNTNFLIINPHYRVGQWTEHTIGRGRNFREIEATIPKIIEIMDERYIQYATIAEVAFNPLYVVIEEVPAVKANIDKNVFSDLLKQIGSEGRKVKIFLILITQSRYTKQLGFEGASDMLENFMIIRVAKPVYTYEIVNQEGVVEIQQGKFTNGYSVNLPEDKIYSLS